MRTPAGRRYAHVPRNEAVRKSLRPVYTLLSRLERGRLAGPALRPNCRANARRYVAAMVKSLLDVAYAGEIPGRRALPNLRYLGVGPLPSQIIKDVPSTAELIRLASA